MVGVSFKKILPLQKNALKSEDFKTFLFILYGFLFNFIK